MLGLAKVSFAVDVLSNSYFDNVLVWINESLSIALDIVERSESCLEGYEPALFSGPQG